MTPEAFVMWQLLSGYTVLISAVITLCTFKLVVRQIRVCQPSQYEKFVRTFYLDIFTRYTHLRISVFSQTESRVVISEVLTAVTINWITLYDFKSYNPIQVYQCYAGT
jgi:molybdenum cofactor biosynthesis enzyme